MPTVHERLIKHLRQGKCHLADQDVQNGARFAGPLDRVLGSAATTPADQQIRVLRWLSDHQQTIPDRSNRPAQQVLINTWLKERPTALVDLVMEMGYTYRPDDCGLLSALQRPDSAGLEWWHRQGFELVLPELYLHRDLLDVCLTQHRLDALSHVRFLWSQGLRPDPAQPSPLARIAERHQHPVTDSDKAPSKFQAFWTFLVAVGMDPSKPDFTGVRPADRVLDSPSSSWYLATQRQAEMTSEQHTPRRARPRRRT